MGYFPGGARMGAPCAFLLTLERIPAPAWQLPDTGQLPTEQQDLGKFSKYQLWQMPPNSGKIWGWRDVWVYDKTFIMDPNRLFERHFMKHATFHNTHNVNAHF